MDEHQKPEEAAKSGQEHLKSAASDLKEAASAKVEDIRHAAEQKADELRSPFLCRSGLVNSSGVSSKRRGGANAR